MTSPQRNILAILANANNDFKGTLAICVQNANMLFSELFEVSATDLQNLGFGQLQSEAFLKSLTIIMRWEGVHRQTNVTKSHIAHIVSLLKDANQKLAAIENAEYDSQLAAMVATPTQIIQQQADAAKLPLNEYMDLHPEAGSEFETPNFIGEDFNPLDLLEYKNRYEKISQIELDFSQPNNKRFAFVESFYQYCMWHAYQCYTKNFKPIMDFCAAQTLMGSKKPSIFAALIKSYLFDLDCATICPIITGGLHLEFSAATQTFQIVLVDDYDEFIDDSPTFNFCDDLGDFAETCNKRWNAQGNTQTGNLYSDYPIFSFFETVLLNL
jgi:hypothetical protein